MNQNYEPKIGDKVVITVGERTGATGTIKSYAPVAVEGGYTRNAFWVDMDEYTEEDWAIAQRHHEQYGMPLTAALPTYEFRATELAPFVEAPAQIQVSAETNYNETPEGQFEMTAEEFAAQHGLELVEGNTYRSEWGNGEGYDTITIETW